MVYEPLLLTSRGTCGELVSVSGNMNGLTGSEFQALVTAWSPAWRNWAFEICRDWHLAHDAVQEAIFELIRDQPTDAYQVIVKGQVLVTRCAVEQQRRFRHEREHLTADVPDQQAPEVILHLEGLHPEQLQGIPERLRLILWLRYHQDMSISETAQAMGVTPTTVEAMTRRALRMTRAALYTRNTRKHPHQRW